MDKAMELRVRMLEDGVYPDERTYSTLLRGPLRACSVEQCALLVNAALDQKGKPAKYLLEEDLVRSVLMLIQRHNEWETHGVDLNNRLRSSGITVRLPMAPDSCSRNDGFGQRPRDNNYHNAKPTYGDGKGAAKGSGKGVSNDARYSQ